MDIIKALTIAGSDSGGGAGIQADLKTFAALGVHGSSVVTVVTAQNTIEVRDVHKVPLPTIAQQIDAVFSDIGADSVKIGMLFNKEIIETVADALKRHEPQFVVLDPVMVASSGAKLLEDDAIVSLKETLIPLASVITPNIPEAELLLNRKIQTSAEMINACHDLHALGAGSVLLKGGHLPEVGPNVIDVFFDGKHDFTFLHSRLDRDGHGTGCTLSSAVAAFLARGESLHDSVEKSLSFVHDAFSQGYKVGAGAYVLKHS